jgi:orotidine-5'-phosphate decarboxylase
MKPFGERLFAAVDLKRAPCVVGLDPVVEYIPDAFARACGLSKDSDLEEQARLVEAYCLETLDAVHDLVPAVKPQMAYFEVFGSHGLRALERLVEVARGYGLLVLMDGKRGDIGSTSRAYAEAYLAPRPGRALASDALTLSPYLGSDSLEPFVDVALAHGNGLFVCVRTSNPGGEVIQAVTGSDGRAVYEVTADLVAGFNAPSIGAGGYGSIGAVVGATQAEAARRLRARLPGVPFLVPGYGAQGGSLETVRACFDPHGRGAVVNSSRAVMYPERFGGVAASTPRDAIRQAAQAFVEAIRAVVGG